MKYQIWKIHGLPIVRERLTHDFYLYDEVLYFLRSEFIKNADIVAYMGGTIELDLLIHMGFKSINLEVRS